MPGEIIGCFTFYFLTQVMELNRSESLHDENSLFINDALVQMSFNTSDQPTPPATHQDAAYPPSISNSDSERTSENQVDLQTDVSQPTGENHELWTAAESCHPPAPLHQSSEDACQNDLDISGAEFPTPPDSNPSGPELQTCTAEAKLNLQTLTRQDGETGDGAEENIVYL